MKISIVTVVYNNPLLREALDSILAQQLGPNDELELVVIDGGSTDGTLDVIRDYRTKLNVCLSERDEGIYDAMNKGIECATGEIIGTLNSDDIYQDDQVLSTVLKEFQSSDTQIVYGDLVYVSRMNPSKVVRYWKSQPYKEGLFQQGWMPPHPTFFVRKEVYEKYGRFDLIYHLASDFELTLRLLAKARLAFRYMPKVLVRMRLGGATNKSLMNIIRANLECQRACRKNGLKIPAWFILRKTFSKLGQLFNHP